MNKKLNYQKHNFVIANHLVGERNKEIFGPGDAIFDFLNRKKVKLLYIRYGLYDQPYPTRINTYSNSKEISEELGFDFSKIPIPFRYFIEIFYSMYQIIKREDKIDVWIGCNSLNTLPGIFLKKLGKVNKVIFYTIDYVPKRFEQKVLNDIYHLIDRYCLFGSDQVWNNSEVMRQIRAKQGVPDEKNLKIGHGADLSRIKLLKEIKNNTLIILGNITKAINFEMIINSFKEVLKKNKHAKIVLVGSGDSEGEVRSIIGKEGLSESFKILGRWDHDMVLKELPKYGIGLAIYGNTFDWNLYSDSLKVKEYLACGLPVIMSGAPAAQEEIRNSGAVMIIDIDQDQLTEAMVKLLTNKDVYNKYKKNALEFRKTLDWNDIYNDAFENLFK